MARERDGGNAMNDALEALYANPLPADRTGPLYNAFSYPTKISPESIGLFIACHTEPGAHVLDTFGGSGTTAIGALLCERPTERMLTLAAERGLEPRWGPRNATVYELSEIGSLIARVMTNAPHPAAFERAAKQLVQTAEQSAPALYATTGPSGEAAVIRHVIWSDIVICPSCGFETTYADARVRYDPLRFADLWRCACGYECEPENLIRSVEKFRDPWTGESLVRRRRVPWRVYGRSASGNFARHGRDSDSAEEAAALAMELPQGAPLARLRWGDLHRSGYHQGITHLHHLYTARNFRAVAKLMELVETAPPEMREPLRLLVLSFNAAHSTLMTRVVLKKGSKDFILTGAQSGVMYVSGLPVEKNVFAGVRRKIGTFTRAFELLHGLAGQASVVTASSTQLQLPDESVDYVFTDPPFGGYIPYSEINQVNEFWLGALTNSQDEAIVSAAQSKSLNDYRELLTSVFKEVARVLKKDAEATLVFHSAHASVWQALAQSLADAGLSVAAASILDKVQGSFKQVNSRVTVTGDPLLRIRKTQGGSGPELLGRPKVGMVDLMGESARRVPSAGDVRSIQHEYSRLVGEALVRGVPITLGAEAVYKLQGSHD